MVNLIIFCLAIIGLTNILVDPATIAQPLRKKIESLSKSKLMFNSQVFWEWMDKLLSCYQCAGFWSGIFCGIILISYNPFVALACGFAGSFIATWGAVYLNYLEARSIVAELPDE